MKNVIVIVVIEFLLQTGEVQIKIVYFYKNVKHQV